MTLTKEQRRYETAKARREREHVSKNELDLQERENEKNRCATRKFESLYTTIAKRQHWRVFPYQRGDSDEKSKGQLPHAKSRRLTFDPSSYR